MGGEIKPLTALILLKYRQVSKMTLTKHALAKFYSFQFKKQRIDKKIAYTELEQCCLESISRSKEVRRIKCVDSIIDNGFKDCRYYWDKETNLVFVKTDGKIVTCYGRNKNFKDK